MEGQVNIVTMATNYDSVTPVAKVKRWSTVAASMIRQIHRQIVYTKPVYVLILQNWNSEWWARNGGGHFSPILSFDSSKYLENLPHCQWM